MSRKPKLKDVDGKPVLVVQEPAPLDFRSNRDYVEAWYFNEHFLTDRYDTIRAVQQCWVKGDTLKWTRPGPEGKGSWQVGSQISDHERAHTYATEADAWEVAANRFEAWVAERRELIRNRGVRT